VVGDVTDPVDVLFEEFLAGWTHDEPADLDSLLKRAGPASDELARLIDTFLARAPRRSPSEDARNAISAMAAPLEREPPLLAARVTSRKRVRDVVQRILAACGLPAEAESLVRSYYQQLEGGLLDPRGVSVRVWTALEQTVGPAARKLALEGYTPTAPTAPAIAFHRAASSTFDEPLPPPSLGETDEDLRSRVASLFTAEPVD
jgi:hypothetical protein